MFSCFSQFHVLAALSFTTLLALGCGSQNSGSDDVTLDPQLTLTNTTIQNYVAELDVSLHAIYNAQLDSMSKDWNQCASRANNDSRLIECKAKYENAAEKILKAISVDLDTAKNETIAELSTEAEALGEKGQAIVKDVASLRGRYETCKVNAFSKNSANIDALFLASCEDLFRSEHQRIKSSIANVDVNPLDTF